MKTQKQLEGMDSSELSLIILKLKFDGVAEKYSTSPPSTAFALVKDGSGSLTVSFDINSWSDMGPIIHLNNIPINPVGNPKFVKLWIAGNDEASACGENPLRAAAIVYILINQEGLNQ